MAPSSFIRPMHPKTEILPDAPAIRQTLARGWIGQMKVHGHRAQIHIPASSESPILAYTRQGKFHKKALSPSMQKELLRLFRPAKNWNVIDAEWLKEEERLLVFDFLKNEGETLYLRTFPERWALLPRAFLSPHVAVLPLLRDLPACLKVMNSDNPHCEGLVFKSTTSAGFSDTSIVRCRRRK